MTAEELDAMWHYVQNCCNVGTREEVEAAARDHGFPHAFALVMHRLQYGQMAMLHAPTPRQSATIHP
jgi:hypothetical protein